MVDVLKSVLKQGFSEPILHPVEYGRQAVTVKEKLNKWVITLGYQNLGHILVDSSVFMETHRVLIDINLEVLSFGELLTMKLKVYSDMH